MYLRVKFNWIFFTCGHWSEKSADPSPKRQRRRKRSSRKTRWRPCGKEDSDDEDENNVVEVIFGLLRLINLTDTLAALFGWESSTSIRCVHRLHTVLHFIVFSFKIMSVNLKYRAMKNFKEFSFSLLCFAQFAKKKSKYATIWRKKHNQPARNSKVKVKEPLSLLGIFVGGAIFRLNASKFLREIKKVP